MQLAFDLFVILLRFCFPHPNFIVVAVYCCIPPLPMGEGILNVMRVK